MGDYTTVVANVQVKVYLAASELRATKLGGDSKITQSKDSMLLECYNASFAK